MHLKTKFAVKFKKHRHRLYFLLGLIMISFSFYSLLNNLLSKIKLKPTPAAAVRKGDVKFILYWIPMWNDTKFYFKSDQFQLFRGCRFTNCYATMNRKMVAMEKFDAVIFHGAEYEIMYHGKPEIREPHERYVFATNEPPAMMTHRHLQLYNFFYNWTMTHRLDSDIFMPYGNIIKKPTEYQMPDLQFVNNKSHLAAWLVTHCITTNKRENVYNRLAKFMKVHVYGGCGPFRCPTDTDPLRVGSVSKCYDFLAQKYKFYLAFENCHCKDYASEKLYLALERNIVPIVYGFADYEKITPPNSVINAEKFKNIKQLARYILFLDENPKAYLKYLEWKKYYVVEKFSNAPACALCQMLNNPAQPPKVYKDIYKWWWGENQSYCDVIPHLIDSMYDYSEEEDFDKLYVSNTTSRIKIK